jgi:hypothetical protein
LVLKLNGPHQYLHSISHSIYQKLSCQRNTKWHIFHSRIISPLFLPKTVLVFELRVFLMIKHQNETVNWTKSCNFTALHCFQVGPPERERPSSTRFRHGVVITLSILGDNPVPAEIYRRKLIICRRVIG